MAGNKQLKQLGARLHTLAVLRGLLQDETVARLVAYFDALGAKTAMRQEAYCAFAASLYTAGGDLGLHVLALVLESDNPVVRQCAQGLAAQPALQNSLAAELATLTELSAVAPAELALAAGGGPALPLFANTAVDFAAAYARRLAEVATHGYGIFAAYHMFTLGEGATLLPVKNPDPQRIADLTGYEREREQVLINTRALLRGLPANNILLYGDAGTGKSSTVKAIGNEYRAEGLRLVEVRKNQLFQIPLLMDRLAGNPLKFILFIDDLSFPADDGDFTTLKAILEGNISARPRNIVVYATSNRRQMVKLRFAERMGDDVHLSDTVEEEASLAARFGLTITFLKPDRELFASIVQALAAEYGLTTPLPQLLAQAEAHAIRHGGRSGRTARQFVEYWKAVESEQ